MHVYFYARGIIPQVKIFESLAQGVFWQWTRKNIKTNQEETILVQGALRPSILGAWEYVLPEDCLAEFLAMLGITDQWASTPPNFINGMKMIVSRKLFGAEKVPEEIFEQTKKINTSVMVNGTKRGLSSLQVQSVSFHLIGIKKDRFDVLPGTDYFQEFL